MQKESSLSKSTPTNGIEFGNEPVLFGSLDAGMIALVGSISSLVGWSLLGPIGGLAIAAAAANDWRWAIGPKANSHNSHNSDNSDSAAAPAAAAAQTAAPAAAAAKASAAAIPKADILTQLQADCPSLIKLLRCDPVRIVGAQRTGKTSLARLIMLLRQVALPDHIAIAASPDHEARGWPDCFMTVGFDGHGDGHGPRAIAAQWQILENRCKAGGADRQYRSTLWDEFARIDEFVDSDRLSKGIKSLLCAASKNGELPIFICHGEQANFGLPGVENFVTSFLARTIRVETFGETITGDDGLPQVQPSGRFQITWLNGSISSESIPDWLTEDYLVSLLPQAAAAQPSPATAGPAQPDIYIGEPAAAQPAQQLSQQLAIVEFLDRKGQPYTLRDLQRSSLPALNGLAAPDIQQLLAQLVELGQLNEARGIYWRA